MSATRKFLAVAVVVYCCFSAAETIHAGIYVPPGLTTGDPYHLAFVTDDKRSATIDSIGYYNDFVNAQAAMNPDLTGTDDGVQWKVIGSTATVAARDNALVEAPVYLLDGRQLATGYSDLWDDTIGTEFNVTQTLTTLDASLPVEDIWIWTGTLPDGDSAVAALGEPTVLFGKCTNLSPEWWTWADTYAADLELRFYALSEPLVAPEPTFIHIGFTDTPDVLLQDAVLFASHGGDAVPFESIALGDLDLGETDHTLDYEVRADMTHWWLIGHVDDDIMYSSNADLSAFELFDVEPFDPPFTYTEAGIRAMLDALNNDDPVPSFDQFVYAATNHATHATLDEDDASLWQFSSPGVESGLVTVSMVVVPEPSTFVPLAVGTVALLACARRRRGVGA